MEVVGVSTAKMTVEATHTNKSQATQNIAEEEGAVVAEVPPNTALKKERGVAAANVETVAATEEVTETTLKSQKDTNKNTRKMLIMKKQPKTLLLPLRMLSKPSEQVSPFTSRLEVSKT